MWQFKKLAAFTIVLALLLIAGTAMLVYRNADISEEPVKLNGVITHSDLVRVPNQGIKQFLSVKTENAEAFILQVSEETYAQYQVGDPVVVTATTFTQRNGKQRTEYAIE